MSQQVSSLLIILTGKRLSGKVLWNGHEPQNWILSARPALEFITINLVQCTRSMSKQTKFKFGNIFPKRKCKTRICETRRIPIKWAAETFRSSASFQLTVAVTLLLSDAAFINYGYRKKAGTVLGCSLRHGGKKAFGNKRPPFLLSIWTHPLISTTTIFQYQDYVGWWYQMWIERYIFFL